MSPRLLAIDQGTTSTRAVMFDAQAWPLAQVDGARAAAARGALAFGTIDAFLLWRLTSGRAHATDATNASRTMLYDIHRNRWDDDLLALLQIPARILPEVHVVKHGA